MRAAESPGVRFPPPLINVLGILAGALLDRALPLGPGFSQPQAGALLVAGGLALDLWAALALHRARTTVLPWGRAERLVTSGPYRFTRNPIYLGYAIEHLGVALMIGSWWALLALPIALVAVDRLVIAREERHLDARFGDDFHGYRARVRRWI